MFAFIKDYKKLKPAIINVIIAEFFIQLVNATFMLILPLYMDKTKLNIWSPIGYEKETKELLSHVIYKLELFSKETNEKFGDFEGAIAEMEKNMEVHQFIDANDSLNIVTDQTHDITQLVPEGNISLTTFDLKNPTVDLKNPTVDLKNLIKQEFSESNL